MFSPPTHHIIWLNIIESCWRSCGVLAQWLDGLRTDPSRQNLGVLSYFCVFVSLIYFVWRSAFGLELLKINQEIVKEKGFLLLHPNFFNCEPFFDSSISIFWLLESDEQLCPLNWDSIHYFYKEACIKYMDGQRMMRQPFFLPWTLS